MTPDARCLPRLPRGFAVLIAAQFASALADNALLIVTIALLAQQGLPGWWAPLLKFGLTVSYVAFAPFVGPLADSFLKARLMAGMNAVKFAGVGALMLGVHPVAAFVVVGFGAAAHAPAKYGLITELVGPENLVRANGWLEVSVVCAALFGTVVGGALVSPGVLHWAHGWTCQWRLGCALSHAGALSGSLGLVMGIFAVAALLCAAVPDSGVRYPASQRHPARLARDFWQANRMLWRDPDGGLSMAVTTIFWGIGATLQFAVLRWAEGSLHLPLDRCAYLQAAVAVGVVGGAGAAARWVPLQHAKLVLPAGVLLGLMMPVVASTSRLNWAVAELALLGSVGGVLVVPLNAVLQHRGYALLSAGRSVAVQGFNENASVLVTLGVYAALVEMDAPIAAVMWGFGLVTAAAIVGLMVLEQHRRHRRAGGADAVARRWITR